MADEWLIRQKAKRDHDIWSSWEKASAAFARSTTLPSHPKEIPELAIDQTGHQVAKYSILIPADARQQKLTFIFLIVQTLIERVRNIFPNILVGKSGDKLLFSKQIDSFQAFVQISLNPDGNLVVMDVRYLLINVRRGHAGDLPLYSGDNIKAPGQRFFWHQVLYQLISSVFFLLLSSGMFLLYYETAKFFGLSVFYVPVIHMAIFSLIYLDGENVPPVRSQRTATLIFSLLFQILFVGALAAFRYGQILVLFVLGYLFVKTAFRLGDEYLIYFHRILQWQALYIYCLLALIFSLIFEPLSYASAKTETEKYVFSKRTSEEKTNRLSYYENSAFRLDFLTNTDQYLNSYDHRFYCEKICAEIQRICAGFTGD